HKAETMDISVKTIEIDRRSTEGLICQDNIRADIKVNFFVRVNKAKEDVIKVAQAIGCDRASNIATLEELFAAKFSEALKTVGKQMDFISLYTERANFRDRIIEVIGTDLNGYSLEDVAIDFLEQTPLSALDANNILDAQGIRKITELTAIEHVATNNASNDEQKQLTAKNVETREAVLELERQQADAEARQRREVDTVRAREEATTEAIRSEERLRAEMAALEVDQKLGIERENLEREIAVAAKNRERVLAVEEERVRKAAELEDMSRKVETLAAEKSLEEELAGIADLRRSRIAVEKTVAVQEEEIASLRVVEEANRQKDAAVIMAEGDAQAALVKDIKAAEASHAAAEHRAKEQVRMANAELESSQLEAQAKIRMAEGVQAEAAAPGLAEIEVLEAKAHANEKLGLAEVNIDRARAEAVRELGEAEAAKLRDAGMAQAEVTEAKLKGEAKGLTDKAAAMRELEGVGQEHEEFIRRLDADTSVRLAEVEASIGVATAQATAMKAGLETATIDIVGGSDMFVDKLVGSIVQGKQVDGMVQKSDTIGKILEPYQDGDEDLIATLAEAISGLGAEGIRDLSVADLMKRLGN
ncbi:MAG: flotillin family protein, partial [Acidimicrobiales bacterium]